MISPLLNRACLGGRSGPDLLDKGGFPPKGFIAAGFA
jgi:hypothetical protein